MVGDGLASTVKKRRVAASFADSSGVPQDLVVRANADGHVGDREMDWDEAGRPDGEEFCSGGLGPTLGLRFVSRVSDLKSVSRLARRSNREV
jgi:hypothetical protein